MITFSSKFTNVSTLSAEYEYLSRNQSGLILYVNYVTKGTETGLILKFETRNPLISTADFYKIVEKDAVTDIVEDLIIKIRGAGNVIVPIPVPLQSDSCKIIVSYDAAASAITDVKIDIDRDTIRYT